MTAKTASAGLRIPRPGDLLRLTGACAAWNTDADEPHALPAGSLVLVTARRLYPHDQGFQLELAAWDERRKEPVPCLSPIHLDEGDNEDGTLAVAWL